MKKRILAVFLSCILLTGCAGPASTPTSRDKNTWHRYEAGFFDVFDTVTTVTGYTETEEEFKRASEAFHEKLLYYNKLFDIYHDYEGVVNLKTINDHAGGEPLAVDPELVEFLLFCREMCLETDLRVDITLGAVLSVWHEARKTALADPERAYVPEKAVLQEAALHTGFDLLEIDEEKHTVRLTDPDASLDVGAIAKGYAAAKGAEASPDHMLFSVGGNIIVNGTKGDGSPWNIGIQDPDEEEEYLCVVQASGLSVVSSGDYQRYYEADGVRYHHIIDPDTLFPADRYRGVSVIGAESGVCDVLSTALFLSDRESGEALLKKYHAEAMWVEMDGTVSMTEGFEALVRK